MTSTKTDALHVGHRKRLKMRFLDDPERLADYELLELLLGYAFTRKDTKPLAKALLTQFGSVKAVLGARKEELERVSGFGAGTWTLWQVFRECMARVSAAELMTKEPLNSPEIIVKVARQRFYGVSHEECWIALLDVGLRCIGWEKLMQGSIDAIPLTPRDVVARVLSSKAHAFVLVHNHPGGSATPSRADIVLTEQLRQLSCPMDIKFIEHIIITEKECRSILSGHIY